MNGTDLDLGAFREAVKTQGSRIFENAVHTQYGVSIDCPECGELTKWVEGSGEIFRMQPCGHDVRGVNR